VAWGLAEPEGLAPAEEAGFDEREGEIDSRNFAKIFFSMTGM
jgi:hypothetical protein